MSLITYALIDCPEESGRNIYKPWSPEDEEYPPVDEIRRERIGSDHENREGGSINERDQQDEFLWSLMDVRHRNVYSYF
jgi:hypothetical protein